MEREDECFKLAEERLQYVASEKTRRESAQGTTRAGTRHNTPGEILQSINLRGFGVESEHDNESIEVEEPTECMISDDESFAQPVTSQTQPSEDDTSTEDKVLSEAIENEDDNSDK